MSSRRIAPFQKARSSFYWFRLGVSGRDRPGVGKCGVLASLKTSDLAEARPLSVARQQALLDRFIG